MATGSSIGRPLPHRGVVWFAAFSPDGKTVLSTSLNGEARLWDARTGTLLHDLSGHRGEISQGVFSRDGKTLVTAGEDGKPRIWTWPTAGCCASWPATQTGWSRWCLELTAGPF